MNAPTHIDFRPWSKQMYQKHQYVRSQKLLKLVASLNCQLCGSGSMVQAAHTNWGAGKGRGIKADDNMTAALCMKCHFDIDQGSKLSKAERQEFWILAHVRTVRSLLDSGQWPVKIPVPVLPQDKADFSTQQRLVFYESGR